MTLFKECCRNFTEEHGKKKKSQRKNPKTHRFAAMGVLGGKPLDNGNLKLENGRKPTDLTQGSALRIWRAPSGKKALEIPVCVWIPSRCPGV
jgi:hypothetical protein